MMKSKKETIARMNKWKQLLQEARAEYSNWLWLQGYKENKKPQNK